MANANPYLIERRVRDATILELREIFAPRHNTAVVPPFQYNYIETSSSGYIQFYGNPVNGNTFTIGTNTITFVSGTPSGLQVRIGANQQVTLANLVTVINANSSVLLVTATTNKIPNQINLTAISQGVAGNLITLAVNSLVLRISAPTLTQGGLFDFDNSEIFISDAIPQDYQDWPCVIVDTASASETRYLGPEDSFEIKNEFGVVIQSEIFSSLVVTLNISIYTIDDTLARDNIVDLIYNNTSEIRHQWAINGIEMIDRTMPPETRVFQDQRQYITNRFIFRVYCEWSDNTEITNVSSVSVSVPVTENAIPVINSPISASYTHGLTFIVNDVVDATHLTVENAFGLSSGDVITQGGHTTTITTVGLPFTITSITDATHLVVNTTAGLTVGDVIVQGTNSTNIAAITDGTHLIVGNTVGFIDGLATDISITPNLIVGNTSGWVTGNALDTSVNSTFNYVITASNTPTSFGAVGLPSGLTVDASNGLVNGVPLVIGVFYITIYATNASGAGNQSLTITIS